MVCLLDEDHVQIPVIDVIGLGQKKESLVNVTPYKSIESIFTEVAAAFDYTASEIELSLHKGSETHKLNNYKEKTLQEAGLIISNADNATIYIDHHTSSRNMYVCVQEEDDLLLGASASPTTGEQQIAGELPPALMGDYDIYSSQRPNLRPIVTETTNYVGLVNQAMTCYLNSLLQALYMTPEFRNALYNWEFDGQNDTRSIPFQLQKLFLNLQTSSKSAVETTDLTTSFGWQGSDAWHQHDIQELCRVMFDALEQKFKDTKQANLINDLYEGSWLDYVKCLECGTEKSREDTFQDIPLPVRPFGSTVAYNSIEEALRAFVQPETLDGNNQYLCEKCNKKCDAHKGLKFIKFPYLLTLHLKRFDFDYTTMHRIKLNDKVVFPELLNLNSFLCSRNTESESLDEKETAVKCDDCSTTDSGSADDESCQGTDVSSTVNGQDDNCADSDEGIDVNSGNNLNESEAKGPYMYELFSIMIHSGSASGGHYYAYIKDFDKNLWFCFNDQSVTGITEDDIRKSHGGGPQRGYYSGAYSSSTNAYMLMYRQIDSERNCHAITVEEFPPHIRKLLHDMRQKEEEDRKNREKENDMVKLNVFCINPNTNLVQDVKISLFSDSTLADAAQYAHQRLKLDGIARVQDCRIVIYNKKHDCIDCSFESADSKFCDLFSKHQIKVIMIYTDWMLEIKKRGTKWEHYKRGGINMRVYPINLETEEVEDPTVVRVNVEETVRELKTRLSPLVNIQANNIKLVIEMYSNEPKYLDNDDDIVKFDANCTDYKLYVSNALDEDPEKSFKASKLHKVIERYGYIISLTVVLPETDIGTLESQSIPSLDLNQNLDKLDPVSGPGTNSPNLKVSPQPGVGLCGDGFGDQSNSEDSSLSDSDRTLVGEAPGECMALLSSNSNSPSDQHMASPSDGIEEAIPYNCGFADQTSVMQWDDEETQRAAQRCYYFKVTKIVNNGKSKNPADVSNNIYMKWCKILVDKRMTLERFKKNLELVVRVPSEYFKIFRQYPNSDDEWSSLTDTLRSAKDGERLLVKLGRVLRKDELDCRVYLLNPDSTDAECKKSSSYLFEHIITKGQTVASVKKEILIQLKKQCMKDIPYNECRLREKSWRTPRRVYFDDQKFNEDINVTPNFDIYLQELGCVDTVTSSNQLVLFVRRWCPSTMTLKPFQEVVLDVATMDELKTKLSPLSEIPVENLEVALMKPAFPCDVHLLDIHSELDWNPNVSSIDQWPVRAEDGSTFFYRDNREALKEITQEEKAEINQRENTRLGRISSKSHYSYSPGRERALKIYLDPSPSKPEDNCVD